MTTHLDHIYRKLGASGRMAAVAAAARWGLISQPVPLPLVVPNLDDVTVRS